MNERGRDPGTPGPAAGTPEAALLQQLRTLEANIGPEVMAKVLNQILSSTPPMVAGLKAALEAEDPETVHGIAHRLKGTMATIGAGQLSGLAARIETWTPASGPPAQELATALDEEFGRVQDVVMSLLPAGEGPRDA